VRLCGIVSGAVEISHCDRLIVTSKNHI